MRALRAVRYIGRARVQPAAGCHASLCCKTRRLASTQVSHASAETPLGLYQLLQDQPSPGTDAPSEDIDLVEGKVLSSSGGLIRLAMTGPVAIGHAVDLGEGALGMVIHYDRKGAVVAQFKGKGPNVGDLVNLRGTLSVRRQEVASAGKVKFNAIVDLLDGELAKDSLLRLPAMPAPHRRRPVKRHLPSGLAAVEALLPLGHGHRVGLVGLPRTGKSTAARFMMASQPAGTACVYVAQRSLAQLQAQFASAHDASTTVIYADPSRDSPCARYLLPICALQVAKELCATHDHVLLVLDDLTAFADAAEALGTPPLGAPHVLATVLDAAGNVESAGREHALSVTAVLDLEGEDVGTLPPVYRHLWRGAEPCLDVSLSFNGQMAVEGILPPVDVDQFLSCGFAPTYQAPLFRQLRRELLKTLSQSRALKEKLEVGKDLGLHAEMDEVEELGSARVARALLAHAAARPLPELAVLLCTALVYHFPVGTRRVSPTAVARFQDAVIATIRFEYPALWNSLCAAENLGEADAAATLRNLGEALLEHRLDFAITRAEI